MNQCFEIIGVAIQQLLEAGQGTLGVVEIETRNAQIQPGLAQTGGLLDRPVIAIHRVVHSPTCPESVCQCIPRFGEVGAYLNGLFECRQRSRRMAEVVQCTGQVQQCVMVVGALLKCLPCQFGGIFEIPCEMGPECMVDGVVGHGQLCRLGRILLAQQPVAQTCATGRVVQVRAQQGQSIFRAVVGEQAPGTGFGG